MAAGAPSRGVTFGQVGLGVRSDKNSGIFCFLNFTSRLVEGAILSHGTGDRPTD